jgi:predicted amidohydrolase YtcJ
MALRTASSWRSGIRYAIVPEALIVVNARVWTGDRAQPRAEAVATRGDRILAVGSMADVRAQAGPATEIDARGGLVTPGFIDAHLHLVAGGFRLMSVDLRDVSTRDELVARLRDFAATRPPGTWITGGDWDHERWGGALPAREWIDNATPQHPVWISRLDGHMALANSRALAIAGVSRATADLDGGVIVRDAGGEPTGLLRDNAMTLVTRAIPTPSEADEDEALARAMRYVAAQGVTSVHHMGSIPPDETWHELEIFRRARDRGLLRTRIHTTVPLDTWARLRDTIAARDLGGDDGRGDAWLRIGSLKSFVDGSLGSHTAAFHDPYTDAPADRGLLVADVDDLRRWMIGADRAGLQLATHAIGDRANTLLLDLAADVKAANGPRDRRFRIEHAQHLRAMDIPRFAALDVIASMQPYHAIDDGRWADRVIGAARTRTSYAWRALLDAGTRVAFGSDWFVAPPTPLEGLYAAVTRQTLDGAHPDGWVPRQCISLQAALEAYTVQAAYAAFEEHQKGRLAPGLLADLAILDRDLFAIPPSGIASTRIVATIVGGVVM